MQSSNNPDNRFMGRFDAQADELKRKFESVKGYFAGDRKLIGFIKKENQNNDLETIREKVSAVGYRGLSQNQDLMASRILSLNIDERLKAGDFSVVTEIACSVPIKNNYDLYHFSSKYCALHCPDAFPVYSEAALRIINKLSENNLLPHWNSYQTYADRLTEFKFEFHLVHLTYPEVDKFLWLYQDHLVSSINQLKSSFKSIL